MTAILYGDIILWERPLQFWASKILRPGDHVLDVGMNVGGVAIAFGRLVGRNGRVVGVEANPNLIPGIKADLAVNSAHHIEVVEAAAFSKAGEVLPFSIDPSFYASASSLHVKPPNSVDVIDVRTTTIDAICAEKNLQPKLIKLDIEGAEYEALQGARETIATHRPFLMCECNVHMDGLDKLFTFLQSHNYNWLNMNSCVWGDDWTSYIENQNILAVPKNSGFETVLGDEAHVEIKEGKRPLWWRSILHPHAQPLEFRFAVSHDGPYRMAVDFDYEGEGEGAFYLYDNKQLILMYAAPLSALADPSCSEFPVELSRQNGPYRLVLQPGKGKGVRMRLNLTSLRPITVKNR